MAQPARVPRSMGSVAPVVQPMPTVATGLTAKKYTVDMIAMKGAGLPSRFCLFAGGGFGKTSFASAFPGVIFMQSRDETGLETLIDYGQVEETAHFPDPCKIWSDVWAQLDFLLEADHSYKTLALDTGGGFERLMHEFVCQRDYDDNWDDKRGFNSYGKGPQVALPEWERFLSRLNEIRIKRHMGILMLCHVRRVTVKNPGTADYDKWIGAMDEKTWNITYEWMDAVFYGAFDTAIIHANEKKPDLHRKAKAVGGTERIIYTEKTAVYDAKHRHGLPAAIAISSEGYRQAYEDFTYFIKEGRKKLALEKAAKAAAETAAANQEANPPANSNTTTREEAVNV
jgi:hypothetical protein